MTQPNRMPSQPNRQKETMKNHHIPALLPQPVTLKVVTCRDGKIVGRHMTVPLAELEKRAAGH